MIWSFCVPGRRVYEMSELSSDNHNTFPTRAHLPHSLASPPAGVFPVISHVCREARQTVLKSHIYLTGEDIQTDENGVHYPKWTARNANLPLRLRKGFDVVHLSWHRGYDRHDWLPAAPDPRQSFRWLANQAAAASVSAELLHPFNWEPSDRNWSGGRTMIGNEADDYFSPHVRYYVVLAVVEIHMSDYEAAHAHVFGTLGEEPIQLADPRDTTVIAKFRDAWRNYRLPPEEPDVAQFFAYTVDSAKAFAASVEKWLQELENVWLWHRCKKLDVGHNSWTKIWPEQNWPLTSPPEPHLLPPPSLLQGNDWANMNLNREHPWVQTQLELMPRFVPALMFRHCNRMCGLPGEPKPPSRSVRGGRNGR